MKIVIDARMYGESGIGRYLRNLIDQLQKLDKKNEYYIIHLAKQYDRLVYHSKNFHKLRAEFRWYSVSEQIKLPKLLDQIKPDLVHLPHFNVPIFYRGKFVVTIHDLIHQHFNFQRASTHDLFTFKLKQYGYRKVFGNALKKSAKILTPSNFVKDQLINEWKVPKEKILVTYEGVDESILKSINGMNKTKMDKVLTKFGIKPPFLFYVGSAHPHKNVEGLIKSFLELRKKYQYLQLVLAGEENYFWQRVKKEYTQKDIIYTGPISDEELVALYKSAQVFVMPSLEEGFGIPLLEAFECECPVVSSNTGSLPEVGGEAALFFDPSNTSDMTEKIQQVLINDKLRKELIEKGKKRVELFSWKKLAEQTLEVYQNEGSYSS